MANIALILAGGTGSRMGGKIPKQFLSLSNGKEIIIMSINAFAHHEEIDRILIVCHKDYLNLLEKLIKRQHYQTPISIVAGGGTRQKSSFIGLCNLQKECSGDDIVLIHDAARPFVTPQIIFDNIAASQIHSACTTAIPVQDTILVSNDGKSIFSVPNRSTMYAVQTPQSFKLSLILNGHQNIRQTSVYTDDAGILLSQGTPVFLVDGDKKNIKITSFEDIDIANSFIRI